MCICVTYFNTGACCICVTYFNKLKDVHNAQQRLLLSTLSDSKKRAHEIKNDTESDSDDDMSLAPVSDEKAERKTGSTCLYKPLRTPRYTQVPVATGDKVQRTNFY